jgi:hypothetical protein
MHASRHGLQNLFNVQRLLTNVKNVIKLYLQRFLTSLYTYHIEITIHSSLNKHTPNFLSHILYQKKNSTSLYNFIFFTISSNILLYV